MRFGPARLGYRRRGAGLRDRERRIASQLPPSYLHVAPARILCIAPSVFFMYVDICSPVQPRPFR